jgi:riboflavin kinase / FMN adenylyltransferase
MKKTYKSKVLHGDKDGSKISYPTANLNPSVLPISLQRGVYAGWVEVNDKIFPGAIYFGPRLVKGEDKDVLEIFILNFSGEIYGEEIEFTLEAHIRDVMDFTDFSLLKDQINSDIKKIKQVLNVEKN